MKITVKHILVLLGVCAMLPICEAQNTVVRRSSTATNRTDKNGLTVRAKTLYETGEPSEADIPWTRGIYRQIDLTQEKTCRYITQKNHRRAGKPHSAYCWVLSLRIK